MSRGGRLRAAAALVAALAAGGAGAGAGAAAQAVTIGPELLVGDYREVAAGLHYRGVGLGVAAAVVRGKGGLEVAYARVNYDPEDGGSAVESFAASQFDLRLRYQVTRGVSAEAGLTNRSVDAEFAAQSAGAARLGVRLSSVIGTGVRLGLSGAYLAAARFSGGGSAPLGVEVGLGVTGEFLRGRLRLAADYQFQYFNRQTEGGAGRTSVPIQQAWLRIGAAAGF